MFVTTTCASGTDAPDWSVMVPTRVAVSCAWTGKTAPSTRRQRVPGRNDLILNLRAIFPIVYRICGFYLIAVLLLSRVHSDGRYQAKSFCLSRSRTGRCSWVWARLVSSFGSVARL